MSEVTFGSLTIRAGDGAREMNERGEYRRVYSIRVKSDGTGKEVRFTFHDSVHNEDVGKKGLGPDDLLEAFRCFVGDAEAGDMEFGEFADNFGYDSDSYSARQTHKACKRASEKLYVLYHDYRSPGTVLEALAAIGVE